MARTRKKNKELSTEALESQKKYERQDKFINIICQLVKQVCARRMIDIWSVQIILDQSKLKEPAFIFLAMLVCFGVVVESNEKNDKHKITRNAFEVARQTALILSYTNTVSRRRLSISFLKTIFNKTNFVNPAGWICRAQVRKKIEDFTGADMQTNGVSKPDVVCELIAGSLPPPLTCDQEKKSPSGATVLHNELAIALDEDEPIVLS